MAGCPLRGRLQLLTVAEGPAAQALTVVEGKVWALAAAGSLLLSTVNHCQQP
jgi:hypothetical protein